MQTQFRDGDGQEERPFLDTRDVDTRDIDRDLLLQRDTESDGDTGTDTHRGGDRRVCACVLCVCVCVCVCVTMCLYIIKVQGGAAGAGAAAGGGGLRGPAGVSAADQGRTEPPGGSLSL